MENEKPTISITLTDPQNFALRCEVNAPNLQVAIHMLTQALEETKHAFDVDRQKRDAREMMEQLQTAQLMRSLPKGGQT